MNFRLAMVALLCLGSLLGVGSGCAPECPAGRVKVGSQCRAPVEDVPDGGGEGPEACGDGRFEAETEECDPSAGAGEGCSAACTGSPGYACKANACDPLPAAPALSGLASSSPDVVVWSWVPVDGVGLFRVQVDDEPARFQNEERYQTQLAEGRHSIAVQACLWDDAAACSEAARHTTLVERFGAGNPHWYRDVDRALTTTALGHRAAVVCGDCLSTGEGTVRPIDAALPALATALARGSDFIDLDVLMYSGRIVIARDQDDPALAEAPELGAVLTDPRVAASTAPLVLELRDVGLGGAAFARLLAPLLVANPEFARNGRPLFLGAKYALWSEVVAAARVIRQDFPLLAPYVRFWYPYNPDAPDPMAELDLDRSELDFDGIGVSYLTPELLDLVHRAHAAQLGVWVIDAPGPSFAGAAVLAGLREEVDGFFGPYRVDQARAIVTARDTLAYAAVREHRSADEPLDVRASRSDGTVRSWAVPIDDAATLPPPRLSFGDSGAALDFAGGGRAFPLTEGPIDLRDEGVLACASLTFEPGFDVAAEAQVRMLLSNNDDAEGGFILSYFASPTSAANLLFGVKFETSWGIASYLTAGRGASNTAETFNEALVAGRSYWICGMYGRESVVLLIDGRIAEFSSQNAAIQASALPVLLGAKPVAGEPLGLAYPFLGKAQSGQILRWTSHASDGRN